MTQREQALYGILSGSTKPAGLTSIAVVSTQWIVITGAPGAGKSALCSELERAGHRLVPEASRAAINEALGQGFTTAEIFADPLLLSEAIMNRKLGIAGNLRPADPWVWDTGLIDALVFCRRANVDLTLSLPAVLAYRFRCVMLLEPLAQSAVQGDPVRPQTEFERASLDQMLRTEYERWGYDVAIVPYGTLSERVRHVAEWIRGLAK